MIPFKQRDVTIDSHLQKEIRQRRSFANPSEYILRMFEVRHPDFRQRIDVDQLAAVRFAR